MTFLFSGYCGKKTNINKHWVKKIFCNSTYLSSSMREICRNKQDRNNKNGIKDPVWEGHMNKLGRKYSGYNRKNIQGKKQEKSNSIFPDSIAGIRRNKLGKKCPVGGVQRNKHGTKVPVRGIYRSKHRKASFVGGNNRHKNGKKI